PLTPAHLSLQARISGCLTQTPKQHLDIDCRLVSIWKLRSPRFLRTRKSPPLSSPLRTGFGIRVVLLPSAPRLYPLPLAIWLWLPSPSSPLLTIIVCLLPCCWMFPLARTCASLGRRVAELVASCAGSPRPTCITNRTKFT